MVRSVAAAAEGEEEGLPSVNHGTMMYAATCRTPPLCSMRLARTYAKEASVFHVANTRFWEAALLPIAVVVVVAFSSCMDFWIGQFISLSWWYAANFYSMSYALQVLHPQISMHTPGYSFSPFCGAGALWLWSIGIASLEMCVYHLAGQPKAAHAIGTTLYSVCGCLWLHAVIAPWHCIPSSWRPHKVVRYVAEHRLLELPRRQSTSAPGAAAPSADDIEVRAVDAAAQRTGRKLSASRGDAAAGTCAGQVALAIAAYGLLVAWHSAVGYGPLPSVGVLLAERHSSAAAPRSPLPSRSHSSAVSDQLRAVGRPAMQVSSTAVSASADRGPESATLVSAPPTGGPRPRERLPATEGPTVGASQTPPVDSSTHDPQRVVQVPQLPVTLAPGQDASNESIGTRPSVKAELSVPGNGSATVGGQPATSNRSIPSTLLPSSHTSQEPMLQKALHAHKNLSGETARASLQVNKSAGSGSVSRTHWTRRREAFKRRPSDRRMPRAAAPARPPQRSDVTTSPAPKKLRPSTAPHLATKAWGGVLLIGFAAMMLLWLSDRQKSFEFSVPYLVCFNVVCLRVPDLLGHVVITALGDVSLYSSPAMATTAISFSYMGAMQAYIMLLRWVCTNMSSQHLFPRFHFVAQMYYYLFWYMMLMVVSPAGVEDWNFWLMVAMLNGNYLVSNVGILQQLYYALRCRLPPPDPPLKILFDSKLAVQDQLADIVSLLTVPAIATSFHICTSLSVTQYPGGVLISLWQRFGVLLVARLLSGLLTEEIFRRRVELLYKADAMELQLLPLDTSQNRLRYLNDICVGPKLAHESMRNIERCELYFTAIAVTCTFAVFQQGDVPARYAFIAFGG